MQISNDTAEKLSKVETDVDAVQISKRAIEGRLAEKTLECDELVEELRAHKLNFDGLLKQLKGSNKARESLEEILMNVKGSNSLLEEKLHCE